MPADFNKPVRTDNYDTGLLATIRAHITAVAMMLDPTDAGTLSNTPAGVRRFNAGTGVFERFNGSAWVEQATGYIKAAAVAAAYAPLGGAGVSGTWGISVTGSAGSVPWSGVSNPPAITGITASTSTTGSTVAQRDVNGYLWAVYFNSSAGLESITPGAIWVESAAADGYLRKVSLATFNAVISPAWANVSGRPTAVSSFTNDSGYVTSSGLSGTLASYVTSSSLSTTLSGYVTSSGLTTTLGGYAALAGAPVFTGQVRGNGGSKGLGAITVTTTTGTPSGGSDGDLVLVY